MKEINQDKIKVQVIIKGKSAWLYKNIDKGLRSKAIEKGLMLLANDKHLKDIFFDDIEMVDSIVKIDDNKNLELTKIDKPKTPQPQNKNSKTEDIIKWPFGERKDK